MADIKWIKITTDMFDNRKIRHLRKLPEGNNIVLIWVMLLTMAGRCNSSGMIFLTENIPYTPKMLADELDFEENTVRLALEVLEQLGMVVTENGYFTIAGWEEYQNIEGMEKIREQNRLRKQRQREREKLLICDMSHDSHVTVTQQNKIENKNKKEKEIENKNPLVISNDITCQTQDVRRCVEEWNSLVEYGIKSISRLDSNSKRYKSLVARINQYGIDDVLKAIDNIRHSDFLQGKHKGKPWQITFDWFVLPNNFPKVLEGNYSNGGNNNGSNGRIDAEDETEDEFTRLCREYGI